MPLQLGQIAKGPHFDEKGQTVKPTNQGQNVGFLNICIFEEITSKITLADLERMWNTFECLPWMFETLNVSNIIPLKPGQIAKGHHFDEKVKTVKPTNQSQKHRIFEGMCF